MRFALRVRSEAAGAPVHWACDLDALGVGDGWVEPDSWRVTHADLDVPFRVDSDTIDGRRHTHRFRAPVAGESEIAVECELKDGPRPAPGQPVDRPVPLIGAGEALSLGSTAAVGDLHVGLQTVVDVVDWYRRGELDLLLCCGGHEGGGFVYAATPNSADGRPIFMRAGRVTGFGDDPQAYGGKVRAVDFRGDGRFDLLECRGSRVLWRRNVGAVGAPSFASPEPLEAGGEVFDLGARSQMLCPVDLGDGLVSLIVGTNDWTDYWPKDVGAWEDKPGYRPYDEHGVWRGGPMRGRLYVLRNTGTADAPRFAAPALLRHEDDTPLEVYGLAGPAVFPPALAGAAFDLVVSDFLDRLWYFRNTGQVGDDGLPRFAPRTPVRTTGDEVPEIDRMPVVPAAPVDYPPTERLPDELVLPTCMHAVAVADWPAAQGGGTDLLVAAEDGYVRALRLVGRTAEGVPIVRPPQRLQEYGARLSVGAKACPTVVDWGDAGHDDVVIGNAAGQILLCRRVGSRDDPAWAAPVPFTAGDRPLWLMAGPPGTMQGPSEVKWGYVNPTVGQWPTTNGKSERAIVCGDSLGHNTLYLAAGQGPHVSRGRRLHVLREHGWVPLVTRWRCRPQLVDWGDGQTVYLQVDEDGGLCCYRILPDGPSAEAGEVRVAPLDVLRHPDGTPVRLDSDFGGRIGRLKLAVADWDGDGLPDLLMGGTGTQPPVVNALKKASVWLLRNVGRPGAPLFASPEVIGLEGGQPALFGGHSCVPVPCRLDDNSTGPLDMLVGSENGRLYAYRRAYIENTATMIDAALRTLASR